jgi:hypothetical protein
MSRACRGWSRLCWCVMLLVGLTAAIACASHPPGYGHADAHDVGHPPLCTDASTPVTLAHGKSNVFPDGALWSLSAKSRIPIGALAAHSSVLLLGLQFLPEAPSRSDTRTAVSPPKFLVVLRQSGPHEPNRARSFLIMHHITSMEYSCRSYTSSPGVCLL